MATLARRGTSVVTTSGTTWASTSSCIDGTVGNNDATYGTWTNTTSGGTGYIEIGGYDFSSIPADASIVHVTVQPRHYLSATVSRMSSITAQVYDGATTIGSGLTCNKVLLAAINTEQLSMTTLPTVAQLQSANFKVRMTWVRAATTSACVANLDFIDITVTYIPAATDSLSLVDGLAVEVVTAVTEGGAGLFEPAPTVAKTGSVITQPATSPDLNITDTGSVMSHLLTVIESTGVAEPAPTVNTSPTFGNEYDQPVTDPDLNITDTGSALSHLLTVTESGGLIDPAPVVTKSTSGTILQSFEDAVDLADYGADRTYVETQTETALNSYDVDGFNKNITPGGFNTAFGVALTGGGTSSFFSPDATFVTGSGTTVASGEESWLVTGFKFISVNGRAIAGGNTSVMGIGVSFGTTAGTATAAGVLGRMWTPDGRMTTTVGAVTASGRGGLLYTGALEPLSGPLVVAWADAFALLAPSPSQAFLPTLVPSQSVRFAVDAWRLRDGVAVAEARYAAQASSEVVIGTSSSDVPFVAPAALTDFAQFRWLAEDYEDSVQWYPAGTTSDFSAIRSWAMVRDAFTWQTAEANSWATLLNNTQDPDIPVWTEAGAAATLRTDYSYWRISEYVTSPAVLVTPGVSLYLDWGIGTSPVAQITVALVFVPRMMQVSEFTLLRASNEITVSMRSDATVALTYGSEVLSTAAVGALTRPNEPVVVAVSISPSDRRLMLGVMDTEVRVTSAHIPDTVSVDNLAWVVNADEAGTFELLEAAMLLDPLYPTTMSTWLSRYDRVYGVTLV